MKQIKVSQTLTSNAATVFLLFISLQSFMVTLAQECPVCTAAPVNDCAANDKPPLQGGSPCYCVEGALLPGCVLKPCDKVDHARAYCDSSAGYGNEATGRINAFAHKCTLKDGCECCNRYPDDCTYDSTTNPPADGGPPCSCTLNFPASGCTLKVCESNADTDCVCDSKFNESLACFGTTCPGNTDATLVGECSAVSPTTTTPATTTNVTNPVTTTNSTNPPTTTNVTNPVTTTNVTNPPTTTNSTNPVTTTNSTNPATTTKPNGSSTTSKVTTPAPSTKPSDPSTTPDGDSGTASVIASICILLAGIVVSYI